MKTKILAIEAENFRSYKKLPYTEFSDYTAIVGASDSGKSNIMRLINWVLYNEPSGQAYIRQEFDENGEMKPMLTAVGIIHFDNGRSIKRVRGPKDNYYELYENVEMVLHMEAFGSGSVKEVCDFHGMQKVNFFGKNQSLNICPQMDKPFFLGESAPTRAVMIGRLGKADIVDLAIKNVDSDIRANKKEVKKKKDELKEVNAELKEIKGLAKMEKDIEKISKHLEKATELTAKAKNIRELANSIINFYAQKEKLEKVISEEREIERLMFLVDKLKTLSLQLKTVGNINKMLVSEIEKKNSLKTIAEMDIAGCDASIINLNKASDFLRTRESVLKINKKIEECSAEIIKIQKVLGTSVNIEEISSRLSKASEQLKLYVAVNKGNADLLAQKQRLEKGDAMLKKLLKSYDDKVSEYGTALKEHKKCPICMGDINSERIDKYMKEM